MHAPPEAMSYREARRGSNTNCRYDIQKADNAAEGLTRSSHVVIRKPLGASSAAQGMELFGDRLRKVAAEK
jgi:hypothetical protein